MRVIVLSRILLLGLALGLAWAWRGREAVSPPAAAPRPVTAVSPATQPLPVFFLGDGGEAGHKARVALERVLGTEVGMRARQLLESGALREPLTIEVNHRGDQFTRYRVSGRELGERGGLCSRYAHRSRLGASSPVKPRRTRGGALADEPAA